jgi:hypothetical protein
MCKRSRVYPLFFLRLPKYWPQLTCTEETRLLLFPHRLAHNSLRHGEVCTLFSLSPDAFTPSFQGSLGARNFPRNLFRMRSYEKKGVPLPYLGKDNGIGRSKSSPGRLLPGLRVDLIVEGKIAVSI